LTAHRWLVALVLAVPVAIGPAVAETACDGPLTLQVLGSGGPIIDDERASSSYLIRIDGRPRLLVDAGTGSAATLGRLRVDPSALDAIALTHLHTDHAGDLPAIVKSGYFSDRRSAMPLIGPDGNDRFPGLEAFVQALFSRRQGAFRYLHDLLDGSNGRFRLDRIEIDHRESVPASVFDRDDLSLSAVGVRHGPVPALGYRVRAGDRTIAFSGDQNDDNPAFATMIRDVDLLVMNLAIPENAGRAARNLHASPSGIGRLAAEAGVRRLLLSHLMQRSLEHIDASLARIRAHYKGPIDVAIDGACYAP
jgi:ribonuclease BN (tRNA processing enzyme)